VEFVCHETPDRNRKFGRNGKLYRVNNGKSEELTESAESAELVADM